MRLQRAPLLFVLFIWCQQGLVEGVLKQLVANFCRVVQKAIEEKHEWGVAGVLDVLAKFDALKPDVQGVTEDIHEKVRGELKSVSNDEIKEAISSKSGELWGKIEKIWSEDDGLIADALNVDDVNDILDTFDKLMAGKVPRSECKLDDCGAELMESFYKDTEAAEVISNLKFEAYNIQTFEALEEIGFKLRKDLLSGPMLAEKGGLDNPQWIPLNIDHRSFARALTDKLLENARTDVEFFVGTESKKGKAIAKVEMLEGIKREVDEGTLTEFNSKFFQDSWNDGFM